MVREWTAIITGHYYELVNRAYASRPEALIFGDRLPSYYSPDAVRAMAPFVDAVATNYNVDSPDGWIAHYYFDGLRQLTGNKPVLVTEWYFAAAAKPNRKYQQWRPDDRRTQAERASGAASAARHFALEPGIVGIHWFEYYDEPKGGRAKDHEDYNFGLLDTNGRPYEELVTALTVANRSLVELHQGARRKRRCTEALQIQIPEAEIGIGSFTAIEWPKDQALVKGLSAPSPDVGFGDLFLAWSPRGFTWRLSAWIITTHICSRMMANFRAAKRFGSISVWMREPARAPLCFLRHPAKAICTEGRYRANADRSLPHESREL